MRKLGLYLVLSLTFTLGFAQSRENLETAFDKASELSDKQDYMQAAKAFAHIQAQAQAAGLSDLYMRSITAQGECYYMLDLARDLEECLNRAREAYPQLSGMVNDSTRLMWSEAINKLEGSYYYCRTGMQYDAFHNAEKAYQRCFAIIDSLKTPGLTATFDDEEMSVIIHRELLSLYYKQKDYEKALAESEQVITYYADMGYNPNDRSPASQRMNRQFVDAFVSHAMVLARLNRFDEAQEALSILPGSCDNEPAVLRARGKVLMLHHDHDGTDNLKDVKAYYQRYLNVQKQQLQQQLGKMSEAQQEQYWLAMHDFLFDGYRLEDSAPEMLYDLALFSKGYLLEYATTGAKPHTWQEVKRRLDKDACAIEFVQYNGKDEEKQLGALVLTPKSAKPTFVHIANINELMSMRIGGQRTLNAAIVSTESNRKNSLYNDSHLPKCIWTDELMEATHGAHKVYFAADGFLHQLAIEYLMPDSTRSCRRLTSTRQLIKPRTGIDSRKMLICSNINFTSSLQEAGSNGNDEQAYKFFKPYTDAMVELTGSKTEMDSIITCRPTSNDYTIEGSAATDEAFSSQVGKYPLIHLGTHGFYLGKIESGTDLKPLLNDNSMSQSGLTFAGAKSALLDTTFNLTSPDGILSAKELSQLSMGNVDLIVLSACQSGLGYITADGVYGVQRALKQAGVKAMIVSLWCVDDEATALLMKLFYQNLGAKANADVHEAFNKARLQMMYGETSNVFDPASLSSKKKCKFAAPKYADAFILIDVQ